jgi:hypothetical protein
MIEKVENAYLAILRTVVIGASGIMLVAAVVFAASATTGLWGGVNERIKAPDVDREAVIRAVTVPAAANVPRGDTTSERSAATEGADPNQKHYDHAAAAIVAFSARQPGNQGALNQRMVADVIKQRAEAFDEPDLTEVFANGLARAIDGLLNDRRVQERVAGTSPVAVVNELLDAYTREFSDQVEAERRRISQARIESAERKANSLFFLSAAGVCFGLFLLIVFLSIFIKIEVNLRHLATAASQARPG